VAYATRMDVFALKGADLVLKGADLVLKGADLVLKGRGFSRATNGPLSTGL